MNPLLQLRQLVGRLGALSVEGLLDGPVASLAYDERRVVPGSVFFAMPGLGGPGAHAIPRAIERGAAAIVCEQGGHVPYRAARIRVASCRRALASAAITFYGHPSQKLQVIVLTGCPSRAAVAHLLRDLLEASGVPTGILSHLGCRGGERTLPPLQEAPEALDIQERLANLARAGCRACILELPVESIEQGCLEGTELDSVIVLRITPDAPHPPTPAGGEPWQSRLQFRTAGAARRTGGCWRVLDLLEGRASPQTGLLFRAHFGTGPSSSFRAHWGRFSPRGTRLEIESPGGPFTVRLPLPGRRAARAALAATVIAQGLRLPLAVIATGLGRVRPVPGQLEPVAPGHPIQVLVDAGGTAPEFEALLRELREVTAGRLLVLFGCGHRHPPAERPAYGAVAARWADDTVLTSDNPGPESAQVIAAQVASGFLQVKGSPPLIVPDRDAAIRELLARAHTGDCVLLAGKGHHSIQELGNCVVPFDDGAEARAALAGCPRHARPLPRSLEEVPA